MSIIIIVVVVVVVVVVATLGVSYTHVLWQYF